MLLQRGQHHCRQGVKMKEQILEVNLLRGFVWRIWIQTFGSELGEDVWSFDSSWAETFPLGQPFSVFQRLQSGYVSPGEEKTLPHHTNHSLPGAIYACF